MPPTSLISFLGGANLDPWRRQREEEESAYGPTGSYFQPMMTRPVAGYGPVGLAPTPMPEMPYGRRAEDVVSPAEENRRALLQAISEYGAYETPEYRKFREKPKRFDEDDLRMMALRQQAGLEPIQRRISTLQEILGIQDPGHRYEKVGDAYLEVGPEGVRPVYEPPRKADQMQRPVPVPNIGVYDPNLPEGNRWSAPPAPMIPKPERRPIVAGGLVYDQTQPEGKRWIAPPPSMRKFQEVPASTYGRALDAKVNPVPLGHPQYDFFQRVLAGTATREEQAIDREARNQWARAFQDSLQGGETWRFGRPPNEQEYQQAKLHADRVMNEYLQQVRPNKSAAPVGASPAAAPASAKSPEERFQELKSLHPDWTDDQIEEMMVDEGYAGG